MPRSLKRRERKGKEKEDMSAIFAYIDTHIIFKCKGITGVRNEEKEKDGVLQYTVSPCGEKVIRHSGNKERQRKTGNLR